MAIDSIPTRHDWLTLEPLSGSDWLVTDEGQRVLTGDGVIGHIQFFQGIYEVLKRSEPLARSFHDTLTSAVESFVPDEDDFALGFTLDIADAAA